MSTFPSRIIHAYHGPLPMHLIAILDKIATRDECYTWFYNGSLDEFADKWPWLFQVDGPDIWVTQHNSWGAR